MHSFLLNFFTLRNISIHLIYSGFGDSATTNILIYPSIDITEPPSLVQEKKGATSDNPDISFASHWPTDRNNVAP